MKTTSRAAMALVAAALSVPASADAQIFGRNRGNSANPSDGNAPRQVRVPDASAPVDTKVNPSGAVIPEPIRPEKLPPPAMPLPEEAIEPYLLTQENGPFMVLAHTFKGENAEKYALTLAIELRKKYRLPAYVFRPKDFPMRSMIRGVPPTVGAGVPRAGLAMPELARIKDEAAVLVGNEKTEEGADQLLRVVKGIKPACLDLLPDAHPWRKGKGLWNALRTQNPYVPAQSIFPQGSDPMVARMNHGHFSVYDCPGQYSIQVASFTGRAALIKDGQHAGRSGLAAMDPMKSPLATAHEDAERLARKLATDPAVKQTGYVPYVYHDRKSSRVFMGSFNSPNDPAAVKLHRNLIELRSELSKTRSTGGFGGFRDTTPDVVISPATELTDVAALKPRTQK